MFVTGGKQKQLDIAARLEGGIATIISVFVYIKSRCDREDRNKKKLWYCHDQIIWLSFRPKMQLP